MLVDSQCLLVNCLQPFCRRYSLGCIKSAEQPSFMEKGRRMTLHYIIKIRTLHMILSPPIHSGIATTGAPGAGAPVYFLAEVGLHTHL